MKKILAIIALLFLTVTITTNISATTKQSPIGKAQLTVRVHADNKKNTQSQETESNNEATTAQTKESNTHEELSPEERVIHDKRASILLFIATFVVLTLFILVCCIGCLHILFDECERMSIFKISMLSSKLGVTILLSSLATIILFGLIYYVFSTIAALACLYFGISLLLFSGGYVFAHWDERGES